LRPGPDKQTKLRPAHVSEHTLALGRQGEDTLGYNANTIPLFQSNPREQSTNESARAHTHTHTHTLLSAIPAVRVYIDLFQM